MRGRRFGGICAVALCVASIASAHARVAGGFGGPSIVGGEVVDASTVPWTVALFNGLEPDSFAAQYCGGVLIHPSWVLTARHCTEGLPFSTSQIQVGFAETKLSDYSGADRRATNGVFRYPHRDIALLRLVTPANGSRVVDWWRSADQPPVGQDYWTYGWGTRSGAEPDFPDELHGVELTDLAGAAPASQCGSWGNAFVSGVHICAGVPQGGQSPCFGDSGGPLVVYTPKPVVVGVTSFGPQNCGDPTFPAVYERVADASSWIDETISQRTIRGLERVGSSPNPFASPVAFTEVDTAADRACGIGTDGSIWCWTDGLPTYGFSRVGSGNDWLHVETGSAHTCGIKVDRSLWCWGANLFGQSGILLGSYTPPRRIIGDAAWRTVAAGGTATCGIRMDGSLWCWGDNREGQLGTSEAPRLPDPMRVGSASDWTSIAVADHVCGTRADGTMWCWGHNDDGRVGDGSLTRRYLPVQVGGDDEWAEVDVEGSESCARSMSGALSCWNSVAGPQRIDGISDVADFDQNAGRRCAVTRDSALWCWGPMPQGGIVASPVRMDLRNNRQSIDVASTRYGIALQGRVDAVRVTVTYSAADVARMRELSNWVGVADLGEFQKLATFVDAFIIAISPPALPSPIVLPAAGVDYAVTSFWMPSEMFVLEQVMHQRVLDAVGAHRWGHQVLSYIAILNGM